MEMENWRDLVITRREWNAVVQTTKNIKREKNKEKMWRDSPRKMNHKSSKVMDRTNFSNECVS